MTCSWRDIRAGIFLLGWLCGRTISRLYCGWALAFISQTYRRHRTNVAYCRFWGSLVVNVGVHVAAKLCRMWTPSVSYLANALPRYSTSRHLVVIGLSSPSVRISCASAKVFLHLRLELGLRSLHCLSMWWVPVPCRP